MSTPEISVVIPTREREPRLAFALESLAAQTLDRERFEAIVVRDGDSRGPFTTAPDGLTVRFMTRAGVSGPTAKRNLGWRAADAPLIAFTDDDCRAAPEWLERLLDASRGPDAFLQGRTEPDPDELGQLHGLSRTTEVIGPSDWYETCNMAYPRQLLERLGGFDEAYGFGGEDTDLGLRARAVGAERIYVDGALVWHAVIPRSLPRAIRDAFAWDTPALVLARHPEQRRVLYRRYFVSRYHAAAAVAAAGALLSIVDRRAAALGAIPYLYLHLPGVGRAGSGRRALRRIAHIPARMLVDIAECAGLLRSGARHQVLIL